MGHGELHECINPSESRSIMNQNLIRYLKDFNNRRVFLPTINISELTIKLVCDARVFL